MIMQLLPQETSKQKVMRNEVSLWFVFLFIISQEREEDQGKNGQIVWIEICERGDRKRRLKTRTMSKREKLKEMMMSYYFYFTPLRQTLKAKLIKTFALGNTATGRYSN